MDIRTISDLENAVVRLSPEDLARFREWFVQFDAEAWDQQFAEDVRAERLDSLADQAIQAHRDGKTQELCGLWHRRSFGIAIAIFRHRFGSLPTRISRC